MAGGAGPGIEREEEDNDNDLFGPDNEEYSRTLATSPYPVPSMSILSLFWKIVRGNYKFWCGSLCVCVFFVVKNQIFMQCWCIFCCLSLIGI